MFEEERLVYGDGGRTTMKLVAETEEYLELRGKLVPCAVELNGAGSERFWNMALYWYIGDLIKSGGAKQLNTIPYDDVEFKERSRGQRRFIRIRFRIFQNLLFIAKEKVAAYEYKRAKKVKGFVLLLDLIVRYCLFRLTKKFTRYSKRSSAMNMAMRTTDEILASAVLNLPKCYLEDFEFYYMLKIDCEKVLDTRHLKNGFSVAYASRMDQGLKTKLRQHGAFYGELSNHKGTDVEALLPTNYYTWGWSYSENQIAGAPIRLMKFRDKYEAVSIARAHILIVLPSHIKEEHYALLRLLTGPLRARGVRFLVRPRPSKILQNRISLKKSLSRVLEGGEHEIDHELDAAKSVKGAKLVVCLSHPANLFMECLYVNHPVIAYYGGDYDYHPEYLPYVTKLFGMGLLYNDISLLLEFLLTHSQSIDEWWAGITRMDDFRSYMTKYCGAMNYGEIDLNG